MNAEHPAIRPLDVQRVDDTQGRGIVLSDRLGISEPTFLPEALLAIVGRCTGERSIAEICREASAQLGEEVSREFVRDVVRQLDERHLLIGERFETAVRRAAAEFLQGGVRPARHAGSAGYPKEPDALRAALDRLLADEAPAAATGPTTVRGLVAPHIDLARGHAGYRAAYRHLLAAEPADLYVLFGTGHAGPDAPVTGLRLDWQTPLGRVETDRAFVSAVHERLGEPSAIDLLLHRDEHSLEFQVLFLQHLHQRRGATYPFRVACFLCGSLPSASGDPLQEAYVQDLLSAFRAAAAASGRRVCYIAGADLAHIGPFFGDPMAVDGPRLDRLATAERSHLAWLEQNQPGAFHAAVARGDNPDRICSAPAITLCAELAGGSGNLLHYGQAPAADGSQSVSFCAMAFAGQAATTPSPRSAHAG